MRFACASSLFGSLSTVTRVAESSERSSSGSRNSRRRGGRLERGANRRQLENGPRTGDLLSGTVGRWPEHYTAGGALECGPRRFSFSPPHQPERRTFIRYPDE